jgi:hypothetical protein
MTGPDFSNLRQSLFLSQLELASILLIPIQELIAIENSNSFVPELLVPRLQALSGLYLKYSRLIAIEAKQFSTDPSRFIVCISYDDTTLSHLMHAEIPYASFYDAAIQGAKNLLDSTLDTEKLPDFHVIRMTEAGMGEYFAFLKDRRLSDSIKHRYAWAYTVFSQYCFDG